MQVSLCLRTVPCEVTIREAIGGRSDQREAAIPAAAEGQLELLMGRALYAGQPNRHASIRIKSGDGEIQPGDREALVLRLEHGRQGARGPRARL